MIRCASSQLTNITRQCSTLTLRCRSICINTCMNGGSTSNALRNRNIVPFQSAGVVNNVVDLTTTMNKCRFLSTSDGNGKKGEAVDGSNANSLADQEWKKFQDSITFEPAKSMKGNIDSGFVGKRKVRGGKIVRKQQEKKMLREQALNPAFKPKSIVAGGGRFPALRYSDEETQRLLDEAHKNIPKRTGKRGTRNLKRQRNRWRVIYADHARRKEDNVAKHFRTMDKRSRIATEVKEVKMNAAEVRVEEKEYHMEVMRKWADINNLIPEGGGGDGRNLVGREVNEKHMS